LSDFFMRTRCFCIGVIVAPEAWFPCLFSCIWHPKSLFFLALYRALGRSAADIPKADHHESGLHMSYKMRNHQLRIAGIAIHLIKFYESCTSDIMILTWPRFYAPTKPQRSGYAKVAHPNASNMTTMGVLVVIQSHLSSPIQM
jgi:hypothetical protein